MKREVRLYSLGVSAFGLGLLLIHLGCGGNRPANDSSNSAINQNTDLGAGENEEDELNLAKKNGTCPPAYLPSREVRKNLADSKEYVKYKNICVKVISNKNVPVKTGKNLLQNMHKACFVANGARLKTKECVTATQKAILVLDMGTYNPYGGFIPSTEPVMPYTGYIPASECSIPGYPDTADMPVLYEPVKAKKGTDGFFHPVAAEPVKVNNSQKQKKAKKNPRKTRPYYGGYAGYSGYNEAYTEPYPADEVYWPSYSGYIDYAGYNDSYPADVAYWPSYGGYIDYGNDTSWYGGYYGYGYSYPVIYCFPNDQLIPVDPYEVIPDMPEIFANPEVQKVDSTYYAPNPDVVK